MNFLFIALLLSISSAHAKTHSLQETVIYAAQNSPKFQALQLETDAARLNTDNARAKLFPKLNLNSSISAKDERPDITDDGLSSSATLSLSANLYNNGEDFSAYRTTQTEDTIKVVESARDRNQLVLDIIIEFINYSKLSHFAQTQTLRSQILAAQFQRVTDRYRGGLETRSNFLRLQAQVKRSESDIKSAQAGIAISVEALRGLTGVKDGDLSFEPLEIGWFRNSEDLTLPEVQQHYTYRLSLLNKELKRLQESQTHRQLWPLIFIDSEAKRTVSDGSNINATTTTSAVTEWSLTVRLSYDLWDNGVLTRNRRLAQNQLQTAELNLQSTEFETRALLRKIGVQLQQKSESYKLAQELLAIEQESFKTIEADYRLGKIDYLDYITVFNDFLDAKNRLQETYLDYFETTATIQFHKGNLFNEWTK